MLSAVSLAKAGDALVVGDERAGELDRGGDQQAIGRIAVLEMMKLVAAHSRAMAEGRRCDAGAFWETRNPRLDRKIQFDSSGIDEQCNLPGGNRTQANGITILPAIIDLRAC